MNQRILVLEDDQALCKIYAIILRKIGFDVEFASCGEEAIRKYAAAHDSGTPFRAVILDLYVTGGMDGIEACAGLRAVNPQLYAIVASGAARETLSSEYQQHGFDDFLPKPFRVQDLENCLARIEDHRTQAES